MNTYDDETIASAARILQDTCHGAAVESGWWGSPNVSDPRLNSLCFSNKLCLIHSEISEALEGDRKSKMDEHLPHRQNREVELADAVIRCFDLAGAFGLDLGGAIAEKLAYNAQRADHRPENRAKSDGKKY